ncbi:MAG: putative PEP-binding protein [Kineosporiaceae bacterium]
MQRLHEQPGSSIVVWSFPRPRPAGVRRDRSDIADCAARLRREGKDPKPEIMVPLIATVEELVYIRVASEKTLAEVSAETGQELHFPIGTMIELPRAALTAARIAEEADFFSFGTNDLTQTVWGFSRDDVDPARRDGWQFDLDPPATWSPRAGGRSSSTSTRSCSCPRASAGWEADREVSGGASLPG